MSKKKKRVEPTIVSITQDYERWASTFGPLDKAAVEHKHALMAQSPSVFLRGTFYRWVQVFPQKCRDLASAPEILCVGDLHIDNFGTWRDDEGRLAWGVNDFDEAARLPFTNDLVRLATSAKLALTKVKFSTGCQEILRGYSETINAAAAGDKGKVQPIILAEGNHWLERIAVAQLRDPHLFWAQLEETDLPDSVRSVSRKAIPPVAARLLSRTLPDGVSKVEWRSRTAGVGSLGRQRFVALAEWRGGRIAREAKALVPSAARWTAPTQELQSEPYEKIRQGAVRSPDPYLLAAYGWVVRRLAPDSHKLEFANRAPRDIDAVLYAMGRETANIHAGSKKRIPDLAKYLGTLPETWLHDAAAVMAESVVADYGVWRAH